jgi:hypothetical protein
MIRPLSIFLLSLSACLAADLRPPEEQISLRAKVEYITPLRSFIGTVTPVDVDPRYALTLRVESVTGTTNFAARSVVTFAIHSYSKLFAGESAKGGSYDFELHRKTEHGKATFSGLRVRKPEAKGASLDAGRAVQFAFERS